MILPSFRSSRERRSKYLPRSRKASLLTTTIICLPLALFTWVWLIILTQGQVTIGGVPTPIIVSFLQDETARNAYFAKDKQKLHDRLQEMNVEEQVKAFYRPQFEGDEAKLDQHIHQILYDRTGYVGRSYSLNSQGVLVLKKTGE